MDATTLLEELRRSQDRLRKEVLSGQAMILTEIRSLHQFWKDQLGAGQSSPAGAADGISTARSSEKFNSVNEGLSKGLEDFTSTMVKNIEDLTSVFAADIERRALAARPKREGQQVRFDDTPALPSYSSAAGGAAMEESPIPSDTTHRTLASHPRAPDPARPLTQATLQADGEPRSRPTGDVGKDQHVG